MIQCGAPWVVLLLGAVALGDGARASTARRCWSEPATDAEHRTRDGRSVHLGRRGRPCRRLAEHPAASREPTCGRSAFCSATDSVYERYLHAWSVPMVENGLACKDSRQQREQVRQRRTAAATARPAGSTPRARPRAGCASAAIFCASKPRPCCDRRRWPARRARSYASSATWKHSSIPVRVRTSSSVGSRPGMRRRVYGVARVFEDVASTVPTATVVPNTPCRNRIGGLRGVVSSHGRQCGGSSASEFDYLAGNRSRLPRHPSAKN